MNIDLGLQSTLASVRRITAAAACVALAACGQGQNWSGNTAFVTVGGTASNLNGTLVLNDNGVDPLTIMGTGASVPFTFAL